MCVWNNAFALLFFSQNFFQTLFSLHFTLLLFILLFFTLLCCISAALIGVSAAVTGVYAALSGICTAKIRPETGFSCSGRFLSIITAAALRKTGAGLYINTIAERYFYAKPLRYYQPAALAAPGMTLTYYRRLAAAFAFDAAGLYHRLDIHRDTQLHKMLYRFFAAFFSAALTFRIILICFFHFLHLPYFFR